MNSTAEIKNTETKNAQFPRFVIGIRYKGSDRSTLFDPGTFKLSVGGHVMVQTQKGSMLGVVASNRLPNFQKEKNKNIPKVLRPANDRDMQAYFETEKREKKATILCLDLIKKLKLNMKLSRVVFFSESNKSVFYFTAEGRVDFRQLVRELAAGLRHRIEMKQAGVRDEARAITGNGMCGETLCCSTFLTSFTPVTIRMAKDQGLALNPTKISGVCGRLMCCLQYEHSLYKELIKGLPKSGSRMDSPDGPGKVLQVNILKQNIVMRLDDESIMTYTADELRQYIKPKTQQQQSQNRNKNSKRNDQRK
ncbi:MAG: PSP1 domain-containing protein [Nitrospinales bacterium]